MSVIILEGQKVKTLHYIIVKKVERFVPLETLRLKMHTYKKKYSKIYYIKYNVCYPE